MVGVKGSVKYSDTLVVVESVIVFARIRAFASPTSGRETNHSMLSSENT